MIPIKPYKQSRGYCGITCLMSIFDYYSIKTSENKLVKLSNSTRKDGCTAEDLISASSYFGFDSFYKENSSIKDIKKYVSKGIPIIIDWFSPTGGGHYSIIVNVNYKELTYMDPEFGEFKKMRIDDFVSKWFDYNGNAPLSKEDFILKGMIAIKPKTKSKRVNMFDYNNGDGREKINNLISSYFQLNKKYWIIEEAGNSSFPVYSLRTKKFGNSLWIISGIHGEEPAGPIAISRTIKNLEKLGKDIPVVILPLCNPEGYILNKRYPSSNVSVGSSDYFLPDPKNKPRCINPESIESKNLVSYVINMSRIYKPKLVLDLHEDSKLNEFYLYSYGNKKPVEKIISLFNNKIPFVKKGKTRFNEKIINGIISGNGDGSIDELLYSNKIIINKRVIKRPCAESVVVFESAGKLDLEERINAHSKLLENCADLMK